MQFCTVVLMLLNKTAPAIRGVGKQETRLVEVYPQSQLPMGPNIADLCSMCYGRSLCLTNIVGAISCFCPPDYTGQLCRERESCALPWLLGHLEEACGGIGLSSLNRTIVLAQDGWQSNKALLESYEINRWQVSFTFDTLCF